jgi:hypothetical protein
VFVYLVVAAFAFVAFYPYVSGVPIPGELGTAYQILPTWQYDPAFWTTDSCPTPVSQSAATALTVGVAWLYELACLGLGVGVAVGARPVRERLAALGL